MLIVDDDAGIRTYVGRCLRPFTARVCETEDGIEALALARASVPDGLALVILARSMPRTSGLELHRILRTDPAIGAIPSMRALMVFCRSLPSDTCTIYMGAVDVEQLYCFDPESIAEGFRKSIGNRTLF